MRPTTISISEASISAGAEVAPHPTGPVDRSEPTQPFTEFMGQTTPTDQTAQDGSRTSKAAADDNSGDGQRDQKEESRDLEKRAEMAAAMSVLAQLAVAGISIRQPELAAQTQAQSLASAEEATASSPTAAFRCAQDDGATVRPLPGMSVQSEATVASDKLPSVPLVPVLQPAPSTSQTNTADGAGVVGQASLPAASLAGTSSASTDTPMKTQAKMEGNSQKAGKVLPRGQVLTPSSAGRTGTTGTAGLVAQEEDHSPSARVSADIDISRLSGVTDRKAYSVENRAGTEVVRPVQAEKVIGEIAECVVAFKRVGTDSMDVSIRPDRGTEISLHLSMRNGQVEVVARLERGDFDGLQAHWSGLQHSLSQQGVRIGELSEANAHGQTSHESFGKSTNHPHEQQESPEIPEEMALVGAMTEPLRRPASRAGARARRGWEMWA